MPATVGKTYETRRNEDGTFDILDVPVFGEIPEGVKGAPEDIGRDWMEAAILHAKTREDEGYLPPLHIEHHGGLESTFPAGHFRLTRVGPIVHKGEKILALFADFVHVPEHVVSQIADGRLPYRSVEITKWGAQEIDSVALLDDETPFFRFPLLRVDPAPDAARTSMFDVHRGGVVGLRRTGTTTRILFNLESSPMTKPNDDDSQSNLSEEITAALSAALAPVTARLDALEAKLSAKEDDGEKDDEEDGPVEASADDGEAIKLAAEVEALKAKDRQRDQKDEERDRETARLKLVDETVSELKAGGWPVDSDTKESIEKFSKSGADAVRLYVDQHKRLVARDSDPTLEDLEARLNAGGGQDNDEALAEYANRGPDALDAARTFTAQYDQLREAGMLKGISLKDHLKAQFAAEERKGRFRATA